MASTSLTVPTFSYIKQQYPNIVQLGLDGPDNVIFGSNFYFYKPVSPYNASRITFIGSTNYPGLGAESVMQFNSADTTCISSLLLPPLGSQNVNIGFIHDFSGNTSEYTVAGEKTVLISSCVQCTSSSGQIGYSSISSARLPGTNHVWISTSTFPVNLTTTQFGAYSPRNNAVTVISEQVILRVCVVPRAQTTAVELQKLGIPVSGVFVDELTGKLVMRAS